jgi:hypothetical protein
MDASGGAGGGALLIASSDMITITGTIRADGGTGGFGGLNNNSCNQPTQAGGGGSGGAIRLVANTITGNGILSAVGVGPGCGRSAGGPGRIRLEAFSNLFNGSYSGTPFTNASPVNTFLSPSTAVRVISIGGVSVPQTPTGSFEVPDVTINSSTAVPIVVEAKNVPLGTIVSIYFLSENGGDLLVETSPLSGTISSSTATASITLPTGYSRGFARARWTQ